MRRAARRDANESELVSLIRQFGAVWLATGPLDGWCFWRGRWHLCEVKDPQKRGRANEYTPRQRRLIAGLTARNIPWYTLREPPDVYALLGVVVSRKTVVRLE